MYSGQPGSSLGFLFGKNIQGLVNWIQRTGIYYVPPAESVTSQDCEGQAEWAKYHFLQGLTRAELSWDETGKEIILQFADKTQMDDDTPPQEPLGWKSNLSLVCGGQRFGPISSTQPSTALCCFVQPGSPGSTVSHRSSSHQTCQNTSGTSKTPQVVSEEPFLFLFFPPSFSSSFCFPISLEQAQITQNYLVKPILVFWLPGVIQSFLHKGKPSGHKFCADPAAPAEQLKPEL